MHYATPRHAVAGPHGEAPGSVRRQKKQGESKGKCLYGGFLSFFFFINLFILFIYFWLRWVFVAVRRLSLVAASRGYSLLWSTGSRHAQASVVVARGLSSCGAQA